MVTEQQIKLARDKFKEISGITIYTPDEGTLDDFEQSRYNGLVAALEAALSAQGQETNCAKCGMKKHTPLRVDRMGGYVCLTCIDTALSVQVQDDEDNRVAISLGAAVLSKIGDPAAREIAIRNALIAASNRSAQVQDVAAGVMASIAEERKRQIAKGYDVSHDDAHDTYEIIDASWGAAARINIARSFRDQHNISGYKSALIQAAAQIVAEIERLDRAAAPAKQEG